jgi:hypothetical protein
MPQTFGHFLCRNSLTFDKYVNTLGKYPNSARLHLGRIFSRNEACRPFVNFVCHEHDFVEDEDAIGVAGQPERDLRKDLQLGVVQRQDRGVRKQSWNEGRVQPQLCKKTLLFYLGKGICETVSK